MIKNVLGLGVFAAAGCYAGLQEDSFDDERIAEIADNLAKAGFDEDDIEVIEIEADDGQLQSEVVIEDDIIVDLQASREMLDGNPNGFRQYRTTNLVDSSNVRVCLEKDSAGDDRWNNMVGWGQYKDLYNSALDGAVARLNQARLNHPFTFEISSTDCDVRITVKSFQGSAGGLAGFPANGRPFRKIYIGAELADFLNEVGGLSEDESVKTIRHLILHEIGHTMGFRHSDWETRASCDVGGNEGPAGVGAVHIPNTPVNTSHTDSVMAACFEFLEAGAWTDSDVDAWKNTY